MKKIIIVIIVIMLIIINSPGLNKMILFKLDNETFRYSNSDGSYTNIETFGFKDAVFTGESFEMFIREENPKPEMRKLYRIYKINPFIFWRWNYYLTTSIKYPYKDWESIEKNPQFISRNKPLGYFQEF
ncbi:Uncharacterised protein [Sphingobacterium daejeonense]|nr:Uncharacterised protein [Sphingobacterium daejeonense]